MPATHATNYDADHDTHATRTNGDIDNNDDDNDNGNNDNN